RPERPPREARFVGISDPFDRWRLDNEVQVAARVRPLVYEPGEWATVNARRERKEAVVVDRPVLTLLVNGFQCCPERRVAEDLTQRRDHEATPDAGDVR